MRKLESILAIALGVLIVYGSGITTGRIMAATKTAAPATPNAVQLAAPINGQPIPVNFIHHDVFGHTQTYSAKIYGQGMVFTNAGVITVEFQSDQLYHSGFGP